MFDIHSYMPIKLWCFHIMQSIIIVVRFTLDIFFNKLLLSTNNKPITYFKNIILVLYILVNYEYNIFLFGSST